MFVLLIHITSTLYFSNQGVRELTADLKGVHILKSLRTTAIGVVTVATSPG